MPAEDGEQALTQPKKAVARPRKAEPQATKAAADERRIRSRAARTRRSPMLSSALGYVRAYIPLFGVFLVIFAGVWAYNSFAPHTLSPVENWQHISDKWKHDRDDARARVNASNGDFAAQIAAYKDLSKFTNGWMNDLEAIKSWDDSAHTADENQQTASQMQTFITDGRDLVTVINQVTAANTPEALLAHAADLESTDNSFSGDFNLTEHDVVGLTSLVTPVPTLALPSGSLPPSAAPSESASGSAGPSASTGASAAPPESAAPSVSAAPSPSPVPSPSAS
jgi:hypothetical protein